MRGRKDGGRRTGEEKGRGEENLREEDSLDGGSTESKEKNILMV